MIVVGTVVEIYNVERRRETLSEKQTFAPAQEKELNKFFFINKKNRLLQTSNINMIELIAFSY